VSEAWRVTVDRELCQNHGQCVYAAPQVFAFDDGEELAYDPAPDAAQQAAVQQAVAACPVRAISLHHPGTP
jgi:ferredoxin